jgi:autotransporter family porin
MNTVYCTVWSNARKTWVVTSELATRRAKNTGGNSICRANSVAGIMTVLLPIAATFAPHANAQVTIPSSAATVQLQTLNPTATTFDAPSSTVVNTTSSNGVEGDASKNWVLTNEGSITGADNGVRLAAATATGARFDNFGTVGSTSTSGVSGAVYFQNAGIFNNHAGATVTSASNGGYFNAAGVAVSNDGTIATTTSGLAGLYYNAGGTFTQSATGVVNALASGARGIVANSGTFTGSNAGGINSDGEGLLVHNATASFTNQAGGTLKVSGSHDAVAADSGGQLTLNNSGSITGSTAAGFAAVKTDGAGTGAAVNNSGGTLSGYYGIWLNGTGGGSITNTGTITGTSGTAINLSASGIGLTLGTGSTLNGDAVSTGANNSLTLQGTGSTASNLTGFQTLTMQGSAWTLNGTASTVDTTAAATNVQAGTLTIAGTLNNSGAGGGTTIAPGATLQIGTGGTSGAVTGSMTDNGSLVFDRSDASTYGGVISGTGTVTQAGSGTITLTGINTYSGGTFLNAGTLSVASDSHLGATSGALTFNGGTLSASAPLTLGRNVTLGAAGGTILNGGFGNTATGVISGTGPLAVSTGTLTFLGDNTYTGTTTVSGGSLQVGGGGTHGSIVGNAVLGSGTALIVNRSDTLTYGGVVSGSGQLLQVGSGTTILTGNSTFTGPTTIAGGTLQLGNGGTSGGVVSSITDTTALVVDRSDSYTLASKITGAGTVTQAGSGVLTLSNANTYTGATTVAAGTLHVDGSITSATTVQSGATLGGSGTISATSLFGTAVTVLNGGHLAPGDSPGTLTVNGNLILNSGAALDYELGAANTAGGTLNDLTVVNGNLTLAGTLNVTQSTDGTFGPGLYRLIDYSGTLTNNGLNIGSMPTGGPYFVQTAVANQVNLINATGVGPLTFWDGNSTGNINDGQVNGGSGTWTASTTGTSWTDSAGTFNVPWQANGFAIFQGAPGTVTVNNSGGQVTLSGAQFAVSGYTVNGQPLTTTTADTVIRVGDGTSAGASMTATIGAVIQGSGGIEKTDLGTLVLTGNNTYTGGTTVSGGTLSVASDANLGAASGALTLNGGTLLTTAGLASARTVNLAANSTLDNGGNVDTFSGVISGTGGLTSSGGGTLTLTGNNTYTGPTTIANGALQLGNGGTSGSIAGASVTNNGTLSVNRSDSVTLPAAISGNGSLIQAGTGTTTLTGNSTYTGGTTVAAGTLVATNGNAMGTGAILNNAALQLDFAGNSLLTNALSGTGSLSKTGNGTATLTASGSTQGNVSVNAGTLRLAQNGAFTTTGDFSTAAGATTSTVGRASLTVGNQFTMNGTLNNVADNAATPVTASTATIGNGAIFNLAGYSASASASASQLASSVFTEIHTTGGLSGTFSTVRIGGSASPVDYLTVTSAYTAQDYKVGVGLTWYAGLSATPQRANGVFTLSGADDSFNMDAPLADQAANSVTGWDGRTLTKAGAGTLQLSGANSYTGATLIDAGTLQAGATNVFASSSQVAVAAGALLDLNGFDQQANNLTGAGNVTLGSAALTANNTSDSTFGGVISGNGSVTKTGSGTLILSGDNTYTGATTISAGTLQLGARGTTGSVAGNVTDNGVLVFNHSNDVTFGSLISGSGNLVQQGSGSLILPTSQTYSGTTAVNAGALLLTNGAQLASTQQVTVAPGATLGGYGGVAGSVTNNGLLAVADAAPGLSGGLAGSFTVGGQLVNSGEIRMASPTPASTLTVAGNYTGNNGLLTLSTVLGGDQSATDRLVVHGNTAGQTSVAIQNAGGTGAQTNNGIQIVQVDGQSNGVFSLNGRVVAGAYEYNLFKGGVTTPNDGNWYLRSFASSPTPTPRPEPGGYLGNQIAAQDMFIHTLHDRAGFSDPAGADGADGRGGDGPTAWARTTGGRVDSKAAGGLIEESTDSALIQAGIDLLHRTINNQRWQAGIMAGYGSATTDATARDNPATARGTINGANAGVYATWHGNAAGPDGPYVDTWMQYAHFDNTVKGSGLNGESYSSQVWSGSVEGGWAFVLGHTSTGPLLLEPQVQFIYSGYQADDHTESNGTLVHSKDNGGLVTRLGARLFHAPGSNTAPGWLPFVEVNWWHNASGNAIAFDNTVVAQDGPKNRAELKVGMQAQVAKQWRIWGHLGFQQGDGGYRNIDGLLGARYTW